MAGVQEARGTYAGCTCGLRARDFLVCLFLEPPVFTAAAVRRQDRPMYGGGCSDAGPWECFFSDLTCGAGNVQRMKPFSVLETHMYGRDLQDKSFVCVVSSVRPGSEQYFIWFCGMA